MSIPYSLINITWSALPDNTDYWKNVKGFYNIYYGFLSADHRERNIKNITNTHLELPMNDLNGSISCLYYFQLAAESFGVGPRTNETCLMVVNKGNYALHFFHVCCMLSTVKIIGLHRGIQPQRTLSMFFQ